MYKIVSLRIFVLYSQTSIYKGEHTKTLQEDRLNDPERFNTSFISGGVGGRMSQTAAPQVCMVVCIDSKVCQYVNMNTCRYK